MLMARHKDKLCVQIDQDRPLHGRVAQMARHQSARLDSNNEAEIDADGGRVARLGNLSWPRARIKGQRGWHVGHKIRTGNLAESNSLEVLRWVRTRGVKVEKIGTEAKPSHGPLVGIARPRVRPIGLDGANGSQCGQCGQRGTPLRGRLAQVGLATGARLALSRGRATMNNLRVQVTRLEETVGAPQSEDATTLADQVVH
ncbi:hypothetical protein TIFTF001_027966 [Ficus carica]|uniref:Uncharacterized protein n=1 Tax=Ficus carica TaxID=3494 RepID=A0AA88DPE1_FICCA|nr:hypothetical protein TIFTF001_027966 [Ficus carica]